MRQFPNFQYLYDLDVQCNHCSIPVCLGDHHRWPVYAHLAKFKVGMACVRLSGIEKWYSWPVYAFLTLSYGMVGLYTPFWH